MLKLTPVIYFRPSSILLSSNALVKCPPTLSELNEKQDRMLVTMAKLLKRITFMTEDMKEITQNHHIFVSMNKEVNSTITNLENNIYLTRDVVNEQHYGISRLNEERLIMQNEIDELKYTVGELKNMIAENKNHRKIK